MYSSAVPFGEHTAYSAHRLTARPSSATFVSRQQAAVDQQGTMLYTFTSYESIYDLYLAILRTAIIAAVALSLLVSLDRLYKVGKYMQVAARAHLTGRKPEHSFQCNSLPDPQQYSLVYPRVAVQLPMFNERAVCQAIIDSACELSWPKNRFKVQVGQSQVASCSGILHRLQARRILTQHVRNSRMALQPSTTHIL